MSLLQTMPFSSPVSRTKLYQAPQVWKEQVQWLEDQLNQTFLGPGTEVQVLKAQEVVDETLADQFRILAGKPRGRVSFW